MFPLHKALYNEESISEYLRDLVRKERDNVEFELREKVANMSSDSDSSVESESQLTQDNDGNGGHLEISTVDHDRDNTDTALGCLLVQYPFIALGAKVDRWVLVQNIHL